MSRVAALLRNRFDRFELEPGLLTWIYEFRNREPLPIPRVLSNAFELGVQLQDEWLHAGSRTGRRLYTPGMVHAISPGEQFDYAFRSHGTGVLVGFSLDPRRRGGSDAGLGGTVLARGTAVRDRALFELAHAVYAAWGRNAMLPRDEIRAVLTRFVQRHAEPLPRDLLSEAKGELERCFDRPLYMKQLAEITGRHQETFARSFARRFGMTPVRYRHATRLNEALLLSWSRPDLPLAEVAARAGFDDASYFHRAFRRQFWMTPAQAGRRGVERPSVARHREQPQIGSR